MTSRKILTAVLGVASLVATPAIFASPMHVGTPVTAMFSHQKTVKFDVRNASGTAVELKAGDTVKTVEAGKTVSFSLPEGTRLTANKASGTYTEGSMIAEVQSSLSGNTVVLH